LESGTYPPGLPGAAGARWEFAAAAGVPTDGALVALETSSEAGDEMAASAAIANKARLIGATMPGGEGMCFIIDT